MESADTSRLTASAGRRFAWTLTVAFALLGALAQWRGRERAAVILAAVAGVLLLAGLIAPTRLGPVERAWMGLASVISRVTTPIFMGIIYFLVLTPTGVVRRKIGKQTLSPPKSAATFWIERKSGDPEARRRRMERQF